MMYYLFVIGHNETPYSMRKSLRFLCFDKALVSVLRDVVMKTVRKGVYQ